MFERSYAHHTNDPSCPYQWSERDPASGSWAARLERLTGREKEVLLLLGTGLGNRQLARELSIAERTVKAHIARIIEKLGQETRLQAAMLSVLAHGLLCSHPGCAQDDVVPPRRRREPCVA
ncbi:MULTISPECIES: helix-turn-helix transcriptional regulator [Streptomyces]|uniref:LuxR C-terminal-related transcriptional regulator n=1 Tax=Streptomyces kaempferi TaxID=333725 RepID=A0ABW3XR21_9ACTN|nr:helix-turn-helix transcriptional regulator [Streptomyces sp. NBC_01462]